MKENKKEGKLIKKDAEKALKLQMKENKRDNKVNNLIASTKKENSLAC